MDSIPATLGANVQNVPILVPMSQLKIPVAEAQHYLKELKRHSIIFSSLWNIEIGRLHEKSQLLDAELGRLKNKFKRITCELIEEKRKRWCRLCETEANYLVQKAGGISFFYCSKDCELQHKHKKKQ